MQGRLFGGVISVAHPDVSGYSQNTNLFVSVDCSPCWQVELCKEPRCKELLKPETVVEKAMEIVK